MGSKPKPPDPLSLLWQRPYPAQALALNGLFLLAVLYTLDFGRPILLPLVLAFLISFILNPVVRVLSRIWLPPALGAAVVLLVLAAAIGYGASHLVGPAGDWMQRAPESLHQIEARIRSLKRTMREVTQATDQVEKLATINPSAAAAVVAVQGPNLTQIVVGQAWQIASTGAIVLILSYFMLASGDMLLRKTVRVLPRLEDKKRAVEIARRIEADISLYLLTVTMINAGLGAAVGLALLALHMPNPMLWGAMAGILNFVPFIGSGVGIAIVAAVALLTFNTLGQAAMPPATYLLLTSLEAYIVTPHILGHRLTLNPLVIFVGLIFWGWLWGVIGALLAVPMLMTLKVFCDHVEPLSALGEFLGSE